jgi:predicted  nucleic acid-binding Zn-ribbon protein
MEKYENVIKAFIVVFSAYSEFLKWEKKEKEIENKLAELRNEQTGITDEKEITKIGREIVRLNQELINHRNSPKYTILEYAQLGTRC